MQQAIVKLFCLIPILKNCSRIASTTSTIPRMQSTTDDNFSIGFKAIFVNKTDTINANQSNELLVDEDTYSIEAKYSF